MAEGTQARGQGDTRAPRRARRPSMAPERPFAFALVIALLLHGPLFPLGIAQWLRLFLGSGATPDDRDAGAIIPIDLDLGGEPPPTATSAALTGDAPSEHSAQAENSSGSSDAGIDATPGDGGADASAGELPDASMDAAIDAAIDASTDAAPPKKRRPPPDAAAPDASTPPPPDAGAPPLRDPIAAAGGAGSIASKDANVQVLIAGNVLRKHPLGLTFSRVLVALPSWHQFFIDTPLDPIKDLDHVLLTGPRFKDDSSKMVAVMDFNIPEAKVKAAVESIATRTGGGWLTDTPIPAARARVAAGDRIFAIVPGKRLLVILPLEAKDQLGGLTRTKGFRNSPVGIVVSLVNPSRPFAGLFPVPASLKLLKLSVTPTADGGADVALEATDASPEEAKQHAADLTVALEQIRVIDVVVARLDVIDHTEFVAEKSQIKAKVHVSDRQLKLILGKVEQLIQDESKRPARSLPSIPIRGGSLTPGK